MENTKDKNYIAKGDEISIFKIQQENVNNKWKIIEEMIKDRAKTHPNEMKDTLEYCKMVRENNDNQFGSSRERTMRALFSLPETLYTDLKNNFPEVLEDKEEARKFAIAFPGFRLNSKI